MRPFLAISEAIDKINEKIGYVCNLLVLAACIVSAVNAMIRYAFGYSSNGWLELQWYMFAILVMFGASYTFKRNEHVRVEIFYLFLTERGQLWLDLIGTLFFLIPSCLLLCYLSWPFFYQAYYPAAILTGRKGVDFALQGLAIQAFWAFVLVCLAEFVWRKGLKHHTAAGG